MSKEIGDKTFEFLKWQYDLHVAEFLDDPDGICGPDAKEIAKHYEELVALGEDIALAQGPKKRGLTTDMKSAIIIQRFPRRPTIKE